MYRLTLCLFFITIFSNRSQTSAEDTTTSVPETSNDAGKNNTNTTTEPTKTNNTITETSKNNTGTVITQPIIDINDIATETPKEKNDIEALTTKTTEHRSKKTTRSIHQVTAKPINEYLDRQYSNEQERRMEEAIEAMLDDEPSNITIANSDLTPRNRQQPGYFGKLSGSLVMPALKAHSKIKKGLKQSHQGLKDFGTGTYNAAMGAFTFVKDATRAIYNTG